MISYLVAIGACCLMTASCTGAGATVLASLNLMKHLGRLEGAAWSFVIGFGLLGWSVFFLALAGTLHNFVFLAILTAALPGLMFLPAAKREPSGTTKSEPVVYGLWIALILLAAVDLAEAFSPPVDADSLAYHFALPKQFLAAGKLIFVPRAVDGAIPLLVQMTWMAALSIGGEVGMTLWAGITGWAMGLLSFVILRPLTGRTWALCGALLVVSTPVVLFGAGTGQVEIRMALFVTLGSVALARGVLQKNYSFIMLAGLMAGFVVASKYTGLLYAATAAVPFMLWWRSPKAISLFGTVALAAGFQWYGWNWWNTEDPLFPVLHGLLHLPDNELWTAAYSQLLDASIDQTERPLPRTLFWLMAYPFHVTLWPIAAIESGRTGLGPYALIAAPFVIAGLWHCRHEVSRHPLSIVALLAALFYVLWFMTGAPQRVRHLVPIWPIVVICITAISVGWIRQKPSYALAFIAGTAFCILVQMGGQAVFGASYLRHFAAGESREAFLQRTVAYYDFVAPVNAIMSPQDRVLTDQRQLVYLFKQSVFYYHVSNQAEIVLGKEGANLSGLLSRLRAQHITLLLVDRPVGSTAESSDLALAVDGLVAAGCALIVERLSASPLSSRTLTLTRLPAVPAALYRLKADGCRL